MSRLRPQFCLNYFSTVLKSSSALSASRHKLNRHSPPRQLLKAAVLWAFLVGGVVVAPKNALAEVRQVCYAIADGGRLTAADGGGGNTTDVLVQFSDNPADGVVNVGNIGTLDIESMAVQPSTGRIFAVDGGVLGTVNPVNGSFTVLGDSGLGDIDGLSFNSSTGALFASVRVTTGQDQLVQINPATGGVSSTPIDIDTSGLAGGLDDIDGITWNPDGSILFGIANQSATSDQRLIQINPNTGAVTDIGSFGIDDVEDLSFDRADNLRAVTGTSEFGTNGEQVWLVDPGTGATTAIRNIEIPGVAVDYEALDCIRLSVVDLALGKSVAPTTAQPGDTVTYTITVGNNAAVGTNAGGLPNIDTAEDVIVTDALPAGLTLSTVTAPVPSQGTYNNATGAWAVGTLADGATATLTITATVDSNASGTLTNFAQVTQDRDPTDPLSDVSFFPGVDPYDIDSLPNNGTSPTPNEDDEAAAPLTISSSFSLGNVVFEDLNGNGIQDTSEPGVAGAIVTLLDPTNSNAVIGTPITTPASGAYNFPGLAAGDYIVQVQSPSGFAPTLQDQGADDAADSDINAAGQTAVISLSANDDTRDAGLIRPVSVGDTVFLDVDGSNTLTAGDTRVQGVTVTLQDANGVAVTTDAGGAAIVPATTDANGNYLFSNLRPGTYQVVFSGAPVANGFVTADQGADDAVDSDADSTGTIANIVLASGDADLTRDAGIVPAAIGSLGDVVFLDSDGDGVQDVGEPGLAGIVVTLLDASGNPATDASGNSVQPITTDATGAYNFANLPAGPYQVRFDGSSRQLGLTQANQGADDTVDSDVDPATGLISGISLAPGQTLSNLDAGFVGASLGSLVFVDTNNNGIQDPAEGGQAGVTVTLEDANGNPVTDLNGNPVAPITTGPSGAYNFTNLLPGTYQVRFDPGNTGLVFSDQNAGADDTLDSDVDPNTGLISGVTLVPGQNLPDLDAGVRPAPQLTLVKRITGVSRNGVPLAVANFAGVELDNPSLGDAPLTAATLTQFQAAGLIPVGVQQISDTTPLLPGDEVEYTIYFISNGLGVVGNAELCDVLTDRLDFSEASGITLTGAANSSAFLSGLLTVPNGTQGRSCNVAQLGQQGAVVAELGDLAVNEVGSVTFKAFIDAEQ